MKVQPIDDVRDFTEEDFKKIKTSPVKLPHIQTKMSKPWWIKKE